MRVGLFFMKKESVLSGFKKACLAQKGLIYLKKDKYGILDLIFFKGGSQDDSRGTIKISHRDSLLQ